MSESKISFMNINKTIGLLAPESYKIYLTKSYYSYIYMSNLSNALPSVFEKTISM